MARFETTAATYAARREPYPAAFFSEAAATLGLGGREALIDLGTGPGLLALGFAPYVGRVVGVDPEPAMVDEAQRAARLAGVVFPVTLGRAEDVAAGPFDLVTIGRALHARERAPTLAAFARILAPGGRILICGAHTGAANPWREAFEGVIRRWSDGMHRGLRQVYKNFFEGSSFARVGEIAVEHRQPVDADYLFERALTRSTTSPAVLGDGIAAFRAERLAALAPFFADGECEEVIEAKAQIYEAAAV